MKKGEQTRAAIVEAALGVAANHGLEGITIGGLAERMKMSKSGVFAHFGSREDLQIAVLKAYERRFVDDVLMPALRDRRGLPRLRAMFGRWIERSALEAARGCIWVSGASEYDDRPGAVREELGRWSALGAAVPRDPAGDRGRRAGCRHRPATWCSTRTGDPVLTMPAC